MAKRRQQRVRWLGRPGWLVSAGHGWAKPAVLGGAVSPAVANQPGWPGGAGRPGHLALAANGRGPVNGPLSGPLKPVSGPLSGSLSEICRGFGGLKRVRWRVHWTIGMCKISVFFLLKING